MSSYDVTAEFYDLLQASRYRETARRLLDRWLGEPVVGVVDMGAGTGIATEQLARRCAVTVHAVEPAPSMRAILLSRLAGRSDLLPRVRVHDRPAGRLRLHRVADFAWCLNVLPSLTADDRAATLGALADAMVPAGRLLVQRPPSEMGRDRADLPTWCLGGDAYGGEVLCERIDAGRIRWCFIYRVSRDDVLIREHAETFDGYLVPAAAFTRELAEAGFVPEDTDAPDVVIARRIG